MGDRVSKSKRRQYVTMPDEDWDWVEKQAQRRDCSNSEFIWRLISAERRSVRRLPGGEAIVHRIGDVVEHLERLKDDMRCLMTHESLG